MKYNPDIHHRRSIRLRGYDYSQAGAYFVTICTHHRECLFGEITDRVMRFNDAGKIAAQCWRDIPVHFPHAALDGEDVPFGPSPEEYNYRCSQCFKKKMPLPKIFLDARLA